jgi:hypothetical protein
MLRTTDPMAAGGPQVNSRSVDILKAYLKTQKVPKTVIGALESLTVGQHVSWKKAVERIEKLLEE